MFKKINYIRNYSKFINFESLNNDWPGSLKQTNIIYAPNGSGKTSLSVMFRSMKEDNTLIQKKRSFHSSHTPEILLIRNDGKEQKFSKGKWNRKEQNIEIFDSYYIEDNIYLITIENDHNRMNIFELSMKDDIEALVNEKSALEIESMKLGTRRKNHRARLKNRGVNPDNDSSYLDIIHQREQVYKRIQEIDQKRIEITRTQREVFLEKINTYLSLFSSDMTLTQLTMKSHKIIYNIVINRQLIKMDETERYSLKYTLSEGDKNSLALSFFFAKLEMIPNIKDFIVVIDDPFTSFDYHRKQTTINNLSRLAKRVGQFILLTHDLHFAKDFFDKCDHETEILQIQCSPRGSKLSSFDINKATLTGIFKDIKVLDDYLTDGAQDENKLREVVRCIRPVIEGIFRIKYYSHVNQNDWLGDFIRKIRECDISSPFYKLQPHVDELSEINDYSKIYHHSNPKYLEEPINPKELEIFVRRSMNVISLI